MALMVETKKRQDLQRADDTMNFLGVVVANHEVAVGGLYCTVLIRMLVGRVDPNENKNGS